MERTNFDHMIEPFLFETAQQIEQLEQAIIEADTTGYFSTEIVNDIFRNMHSIKSSSAMMQFNNISKVSHATEDLFFFIRENKPTKVDSASLCDLVLEAIDFNKLELEKIKNGDKAASDESSLIAKLHEYLNLLKNSNVIKQETAKDPVTKAETTTAPMSERNPGLESPSTTTPKNRYKALIHFIKDCEMENIRAYMITHNLQDIATIEEFSPHDIAENPESAEAIKHDGFTIIFSSNQTVEEINTFFGHLAFIERIDLNQVVPESKPSPQQQPQQKLADPKHNVVKETQTNNNNHSKMISVNVHKLDKLMDLIGEMVISEAMVTQNPDLKGLQLQNFQKASRQLAKITGEIQDTVMSIRMVPLGPTFFKMNRVVRDMSRKLKKEVKLKIIGEETEVDKNIIDNLGDPLMHIVRNSLDHGIEAAEEREAQGKDRVGTITLEARNAGSEVLVIIEDDGRGLNKQKILAKAAKNGLLNKKPEDMTDKEISNLILLPGFSTKENVTEFSGRGVGMDVVINNIEAVGGSILVDSIEGKGTKMTIKIPLTLAIINGMNFKVGNARYTLPTTSIRESFKPKQENVITDPDGNEMIMIRGCCFPILRLHRFYQVPTEIEQFHEGIMIMVENENNAICLFVDELLGEQQVVVKALPDYIQKIKKIPGLAGCTLLGDGSISLILESNGLIA
ncbi:chemotaxis protein CheA [Bacillus marasmi]|uniref:chemotaxis protein CheA n=1 Tax=Bacillus marasmi TaxID=1926279 RepID=UPI0011CC33AC|nr:chemotaxis protein CheA [Bacillus marasmi]